MPGLVNGSRTGKKRKSIGDVPDTSRDEKILAQKSSQNTDRHGDILQLEKKILESRTNLNNITTLIKYCNKSGDPEERDLVAAVALCRVFCRLMARSNLDASPVSSENEATIVEWLKERYQDYKLTLLKILVQKDTTRQFTALTLIMRLTKEETTHLNAMDDTVWRRGVFAEFLRALVEVDDGEQIRAEFVETYVEKFDDVRYYTLARLADIISQGPVAAVVHSALSMMASISTIRNQEKEIENVYVDHPRRVKRDLQSLTAHKRQAQKAWMAILKQDLDKTQRKLVLEHMAHRIAPWFLKAELLMDFLTDSFNIGGSTSLMALSGLFYLIQHKNLDYPQFYQKLYSLLDSQILHSKHRSRFFRLLDTFLGSTHLPAALVASFIKRLSRLSIHGPPSGIVVLIPWIYNLLQSHPSCTFMIHRNSNIEPEMERWGDPFRMEESDPMETDALESSLWEIQLLQSHYHPNVATIAKIISEQFTKQAYSLEDFLDHSYGTMLDAELSKDVKKLPEIEYAIPKRIFMKHDAESGQEDSLLVQIWDFS